MSKPPSPHYMAVVSWPKGRRAEGIGLSVKDGWNFGVGIGLALTIALPIILSIIGCAVWILFGWLGSSIGGLL
jgi:hypothetical protein